MIDKSLASIFIEAHKAGAEAALAVRPTPMIVTQHANPLNDQSAVERAWYVSEGACGFAWVTIKPGTCKAARFAKEHFGARKDYYGGVSIWISDYGQSIERKEAYASAFARKLQSYGITAYSESRLD